MIHQPPVITLDGPSGSGKGTISHLLAEQLNWYLLDSGALYRVIGWAALQQHIDPTDEKALEALLDNLDIQVEETKAGEAPQLMCNGKPLGDEIRTEDVSQITSKLSSLPMVRANLMTHQRAMRRMPGLVADGRDMGTVVFPDATVKFFLEASPDERAKRRHNQLKEKGLDGNLRDIRQELDERDDRDQHRPHSPLKPAPDVILIDTTSLSIDEVMAQVQEHVSKYL